MFIEKEQLVRRIAALTFDNRDDYELEFNDSEQFLVRINAQTGNSKDFAQTVFNLNTGEVIYEVNGEEVDYKVLEPESFEEWDYENWQSAHDKYEKWFNRIEQEVNYLFEKENLACYM